MTRTKPALSLLALALALALVAPPARAEDKPSPGKKEEKAARSDKPADVKAPAADARTPPAPAAAPAAPQPPKPAPEFDRLKFLAGNFTCDGTSPVKGSVDHAYKGKWTSKPTLGGFFVGWQYGELKAKDHPFPLTAEGHFSWDPGLKRYLLGWADSAGTATLLRAEAPPDVDQFVFKGTATASFGRHVPFVFTLSRTPKGFDLLIDGSDTDGQLGRLALLSCARGK